MKISLILVMTTTTMSMSTTKKPRRAERVVGCGLGGGRGRRGGGWMGVYIFRVVKPPTRSTNITVGTGGFFGD